MDDRWEMLMKQERRDLERWKNGKEENIADVAQLARAADL